MPYRTMSENHSALPQNAISLVIKLRSATLVFRVSHLGENGQFFLRICGSSVCRHAAHICSAPTNALPSKCISDEIISVGQET